MDHLRRSPTQSNKRDPNSSHRNMRHMLERLEGTVSALPPTLGEYLDAFNSFCLSGVKLASLLETLFQESPILLVALRFREACELLSDKCNKTGVMLKQDIVGPVKKLAPSLSKLRSQVDTHAKAASKHESYLKQLESLKLSLNPNRQKLEQVEQKFHASAEDFAKEDSKLAEALNELHKMRVEVMGSSFLGILEGQAKLLSAAADIMAPLGAYKEVGKGLSDSPSSLMVKEATVGWLAAAQYEWRDGLEVAQFQAVVCTLFEQLPRHVVNQNLRSFGSMSRNDVQCMMYNHPDGLPTTIRNGLNQKVDQLLKTYARELQKAPNPHHKVTGGFHLNPKGIELALRDCCSELEAMGAGAPHAVKREEQEEQITRDVSRTSYKIGETTFGCAMGEHVDANIREKMRAISDMISDLPMTSQLGISKDTIEEFAFHVLNESCTTVTNTAAKTAVQLVFGKANLVLVRPSPSSGDPQPIEIVPRAADSSIQVTVHSSWWLVEDYAAFTMLHRSIDPDSHLGIVDATYFASLTLQGFTKKEAPPELPTIVVTYRQPSSSYSPNLSARHKNKDKDKDKEWLRPLNRTSLKLRTFIHRGQSPKHLARSPRNPSFQSFIDVPVSEEGRAGRGGGEAEEHEVGEEEEPQEKDRSRPPSRRVSSDVENLGGGGVTMSSHGSGSSLRSYGRSDSFGRNMKPGYHVYSSSLKRSGSSDTFSSQSTLVPRHSVYEPDDSITDLLQLDYGQKGLTPAKILAHTKSEARKHQMYSKDRREMFEYEGKREFVEKDTNSSSDGHSPSDDSGSQEDSRPLSREQVSIASDGDLQNVIAFLSGSQLSTPDEFEYERGEEEFAYSDRGGYNRREYRGGYSDWPREKGVEHSNPPQNDNSSSGSGSSGIDDPYRRGGEGGYAHEAVRSRSASASSFHNEQDGPPREVSYGVAVGAEVSGETLEQSRASLKPHLGSMDSGIHLHSHTSGMKVGEMPADGRTDRERERERERESLKENRKSQELDPFDFSKGLGLLISSQPHVDMEHFGIHDNADYQLRLELYKTMDSDSENSGRDSIPLISPSSSGSQSPSFLRTRSEENLHHIERSSSRASTHSVPYSLDEMVSDFNHAPGSRPHHARPYSEHYDDRLSQDSLEGIRGPLSQGLHDPPWDWAPDRPMRRGWDQPFDAPLRGPGGGPYQYDHPPHPERSRSLQQVPRGRSHDDYSPSPGPLLHECRHPTMPPPQGPGPGPYWHGRYDPGYEPQRMRPNSVGPPCPPTHGGPPPPGPMLPHGTMPPNMGGHPMHDNRFRPVPFGPNPSDAPSPASIHSMSPAPSPRPTPPPTPPPPNHPNLMGPSSQHPLPPHGPPPPHMHNPGPPPLPGPLMGPHQPMPGPRMHMPRPPPPWEGPRDFPPPMGHPPRGPHTPMGHTPSPIGPMPGPPVSMHGGRFLPMGPCPPPPDWERNWKHR